MTKTNSSDEVDEILDDVYMMGQTDAVLETNDYVVLYPKIKKRLQSYINKQVIKGKLEVLMGFRRRDFVRDNFYEHAIHDGIAELQQQLKENTNG